MQLKSRPQFPERKKISQAKRRCDFVISTGTNSRKPVQNNLNDRGQAPKSRQNRNECLEQKNIFVLETRQTINRNPHADRSSERGLSKKQFGARSPQNRNRTTNAEGIYTAIPNKKPRPNNTSSHKPISVMLYLVIVNCFGHG